MQTVFVKLALGLGHLRLSWACTGGVTGRAGT